MPSIKSVSIAALALSSHIQANLCDYNKASEKKELRKWVAATYNPREQDTEELLGQLPMMKHMVLERLDQNLKVPCSLVEKYRELKRTGGLVRGLNDGKGFNCEDEECDIAIDLRGIWGYGCWCHFGSKLLNGRGMPVNPHDEACKRMQLCLRCAEMDGQADNYECDPRTVSYNSTFMQSTGQNDNINSFNSGCQVQNPNDLCGAHVCTCEMQLINDILDLVWQEYTHDPSPRHPQNPYGGDFDFATNCVTDPGVTEIDCCGKYPFRYTYNSLQKSCCEPVEKLYNPFDTNCCAEGLRKIGDVC
jgi:hypothetical protein